MLDIELLGDAGVELEPELEPKLEPVVLEPPVTLELFDEHALTVRATAATATGIATWRRLR